ncbi:hypothetical protein EF847_21060 [Actinobacteria bacterium YIM 96077]|uniref:Integral membrane protein n=1 Tax=Phytoactinopolyspora halophila TaxID=1981511 RepID=A0A329QNZ6_9ACTN|nr:hypothetical protein [Phytoactinopolyspora halophila]AYY14808.1 hypothetical protein EF847_21060 [Actinobacteria bacterium YIM 96077]RAW13082.1 hypothetical protein DPM12_13470 [Phytoactinopolyspora halophila]
MADDDRLDTRTDGQTELRIHGVSGTRPETVLDHPILERVAGDQKAGFYRRSYPGGRSADLDAPRRLEAYSWGHLTSGPAARAGWLMLLPFMLTNLAHWMLPAVRADAGRLRAASGRASTVLLRLFGLTLTLTLVLTTAHITMDLAGWQCASNWRCGTSSALTTPFANGLLAQPGMRTVAFALIPLAVVPAIGLLGRKPLRRGTPEPDAPIVTEGERPMTRPRFWRGNPGMPALRSAHVTAATALLAAIVTWPSTILAASGPARAFGITLCVLALAVLASSIGFVAAEGITGRAGHVPRVLRTARYLAAATLICGAFFTMWDHGTWDDASQLPGLRAAILVTFGLAVVLLIALTVAVLAQRPWAFGTDGFRPAVLGLGAPVAAALAFLVAGGFSAGLAYRVADLLGHPVLSDVTAENERAGIEQIINDDSLPFATRQAAWATDVPLVLPPTFAWAGVAAVVLLAATLVALGAVALSVLRRIGPLTRRIANEYASASDQDANRSDQPDPASAEVRRVAFSTALASGTEGLGRVLGGVAFTAGALLVTGLGVYAAGTANWELIETPPLSTVAALGTWLMGAFAIGLVGLAWRAARHPGMRRNVSILWDVGSFWPRTAHPLAPPSYGERAVPDLVKRVQELAATPGSEVVLSGHSQGSVLAAATVRQLPPDVAARIRLVTLGSPLRRLYARYFPAYLDRPAIASLAEAAEGHWRNLYRHTDPIGSWVLQPDPAFAQPAAPADSMVDRRLLDPPTLNDDIAGHNGYWDDANYAPHVEELVQRDR